MYTPCMYSVKGILRCGTFISISEGYKKGLIIIKNRSNPVRLSNTFNMSMYITLIKRKGKKVHHNKIFLKINVNRVTKSSYTK